MPTLRTIYAQDAHVDTEEYQGGAGVISDNLLAHLNTPGCSFIDASTPTSPDDFECRGAGDLPAIRDRTRVHKRGEGLFLQYANKLRPDYFRATETNGILLEVERGKTTTNNMDLLDLWKCHLCKHADYLFLMVPQALRHNATMTPKKEYNAVVKRLHTFFSPGNYTNVRGLHILAMRSGQIGCR